MYSSSQFRSGQISKEKFLSISSVEFLTIEKFFIDIDFYVDLYVNENLRRFCDGDFPEYGPRQVCEAGLVDLAEDI